MIPREIIPKIRAMLDTFPVVTVTGPRQCGKSTLLRHEFSSYKYVSLEEPDIRRFALEDPRGFLSNFSTPLIIDEAQYAPELFSYIQSRVDEEQKTGMYILSGSHNFLLMEHISQSLAGRVAILTLLPFSIQELQASGQLPRQVNPWLFTGGFPRIWDKDIEPTDYFPNYIQTYLERDVRLVKNIADLSQFEKFLRLCAGRVGQMLNLNALAVEAGISVPTVKAWISVLETSYAIFLLQPYYRNFNKRLVKSPKLYFYDTGLVCSLLGISNAEQLATFYMRGELFENMVVSEYAKKTFFKGNRPRMYFWRDTNQNEIDLLIEKNAQLHAVEIKSSATMNPSFFKSLDKFSKLSGIGSDLCSVVYAGDLEYQTQYGKYISWKNW